MDAEVVEQRILEQSMRLPRGGAVTGWAALRLHGAGYFDGRDCAGRSLPVALAVGALRIRADRAATVSREPLTSSEVVVRDGIPCTSVLRALFDEMRRPEDLRETVVSVDMVAAAGLSCVSFVTSYVAERPSWRRARRAARATGFASDRSASPAETRFRLVWEVDAGLPRPLVNQEIFTLAGRLVGVADLFDPQAGVVGEYDGADHLRVGRRSRDLDREERMRGLGLGYVAAVGPDLRDRDRLARRLRSVHDRELARPAGQRLWTLEPPPEWAREEPLEERLLRRRLEEEWQAGS